MSVQKIILSVIALFEAALTLAQSPAVERTVYCHDRSSYITCMITKRQVSKVYSDRLYGWYKMNEIHYTQGGIGGDLLHGKYVSYFFDGQLKEKGTYVNGLKSGQWIEWYSTGLTRMISNWSHGRKQGISIEYDQANKIIAKQKFSAGVMKRDYMAVKIKKVTIKDNAIQGDTAKKIIPPKSDSSKVSTHRKNSPDEKVKPKDKAKSVDTKSNVKKTKPADSRPPVKQLATDSISTVNRKSNTKLPFSR